MRKTAALGLIAIASSVVLGAAAPASAGFYLEGLQPFAVDYCDEKNPDRNHPPLAGMQDPNEVTPDGASLQGHHAWISSCPTDPMRVKKAKPDWRKAPVPQK